MNPANLIKMANQIGAFFDAIPDREQAVKDVSGHIQRSWEPRMIQALQAHVADQGWDGVSDIVRQAVSSHLRDG